MKLGAHELQQLLMALGIMLIFSRLLGEWGRKVKMPIVIGELFAGIILGPTILGTFFPEFFSYLFPKEGAANIAFEGIINLSVIMLLFTAGLEAQLPIVLKQKKVATYISLTSMFIPFFLGMSVVWVWPNFFTHKSSSSLFLFSLFFGTAMAISALPVIIRILMDSKLYRTKVGMLIVSAAIFNDLVGWLIFSLILSLLGKATETFNVTYTVGILIVFVLAMLTIGKRIVDIALPWIRKKLSWPGSVLALTLGSCFLGAAFTQSIGLHPVLGAFITGVTFGDSEHFHQNTRQIINEFVSSVFAPLFIISLGLKVNFIQYFDLKLVLAVLFLASFCKIMGAYIGAYLGGIDRRESLAIAFGLNARGAMEILLGTIALNAGLIREELFVALIFTALITSITSGPLMRYSLS